MHWIPRENDCFCYNCFANFLLYSSSFAVGRSILSPSSPSAHLSLSPYIRNQTLLYRSEISVRFSDMAESAFNRSAVVKRGLTGLFNFPFVLPQGHTSSSSLQDRSRFNNTVYCKINQLPEIWAYRLKWFLQCFFSFMKISSISMQASDCAVHTLHVSPVQDSVSISSSVWF